MYMKKIWSKVYVDCLQEFSDFHAVSEHHSIRCHGKILNTRSQIDQYNLWTLIGQCNARDCIQRNMAHDTCHVLVHVHVFCLMHIHFGKKYAWILLCCSFQLSRFSISLVQGEVSSFSWWCSCNQCTNFCATGFQRWN